MRFLAFHDSPTRILLPSAAQEARPNTAAATLTDGAELSGVVVSSLDLEGLSLPALAIRNCVVENASLANLSGAWTRHVAGSRSARGTSNRTAL